MMGKSFNKDFFKEESKEMLYALGISFSKYHQLIRYGGGNYSNKWQSSNKNLIAKIRTLLESEHKLSGPIRYKNIRKDGEDFFIYMLRINSGGLQEDLAKYNLDKPKKERGFPEIKNQDLIDNFIRGFLDAQTKVRFYKNRLISRVPKKDLRINLNKDFNNGLERIIAKNTNAEPIILKDGSLIYTGKKLEAIYYFIYGDWAYTKKHNLYLPEKKERFEKGNYLKVLLS